MNKNIFINESVIRKNGAFDDVKIDVFKSISSTNEFFKTMSCFNDETHVCIAESQSKGRGRLERVWHSPFAQNIYLSMLHNFKCDISAISGISLILGLTIVKTLLGLNISKNFKVKWPNDVYFEDYKVAGILIETLGINDSGCKVIMGMGINVNMTEMPQSSSISHWTSLKKIALKDFDRNEISSMLLNNLLKMIEEFKISSFQKMIYDWDRHDYLAGKSIAVKSNNEIIHGFYKGIDKVTGHLLLQTENRNITAFSSGDASVIKNNR
jgi:BirA family biotin operon repressor/biotin-[acetyl-CoA-carboxylase] ligase